VGCVGQMWERNQHIAMLENECACARFSRRAHCCLWSAALQMVQSMLADCMWQTGQMSCHALDLGSDAACWPQSSSNGIEMLATTAK
jgi:hypothetical protein